MSLKAVVNTSVAGENGVFNTVAIGGATIGSNALAVTGTANISSTITGGSVVLMANGAVGAPAFSFTSAATTGFYYDGGGNIVTAIGGVRYLQFNNAGLQTTGIDLSFGGTARITSPGAASFQLGAPDAAVAVAQTLRVQSVVAGTAAANGANWTLIPSLGTGTGTPGSILLKGGIAQASGTAQSTTANAISIAGVASGQLPSVIIGGSSANATNATDGFLYIPTSAGQPTGTPTTQGTATVAIQYDTTNHQFWIYDGGAWKQPKTPAAAAIITWQ